MTEQEQVQAILDKITAQKTQIGNVKALIASLRQLIKDGATPAQLDNVLSNLAGNDTDLADALAENVPPA